MANLQELIDQLNDDLIITEEDTTKIKVKHPGILSIPDDKNFWDMPIKHYKELIRKKGRAPVMRALLNLERWNKNKNPDISAKARKIIDSVKEED
jgi:hypothetical protein